MSSYIGGKILLHKVTPHKFGGMMMLAVFVVIIDIDLPLYAHQKDKISLTLLSQLFMPGAYYQIQKCTKINQPS